MRFFRISWLVLGMLLSLSACNKVSLENYEKLSLGMTSEAAEDLLGKPASCEMTLGVKSCTWGSAPKTITLRIVKEHVVFFSQEGLKP